MPQLITECLKNPIYLNGFEPYGAGNAERFADTSLQNTNIPEYVAQEVCRVFFLGESWEEVGKKKRGNIPQFQAGAHSTQCIPENPLPARFPLKNSSSEAGASLLGEISVDVHVCLVNVANYGTR